MLCERLFIGALSSPVGKGLTSWRLFVVSNCEFLTYFTIGILGQGRFRIVALFLTLNRNKFAQEVACYLICHYLPVVSVHSKSLPAQIYFLIVPIKRLPVTSFCNCMINIYAQVCFYCYPTFLFVDLLSFLPYPLRCTYSSINAL